MNTPPAPALKASVDFDCLETGCEANIPIDLMALGQAKGHVSCPACHRPYQFDRDFLRKLEQLRQLVTAIHAASDILDDCQVAVNTPAGAVKLPYRLLLTRLNTLISLTVNGRVVDFNFRVEPLSPDTFR